jgi:hypothetical protein
MHGGNDPLNSERERDVKKVLTGLTAKLPPGEIQNVHVSILPVHEWPPGAVRP